MTKQKASRVDLLEKKVNAIVLYLQDVNEKLNKLQMLSTGNRITLERFSEYPAIANELIEEAAKAKEEEAADDVINDLKKED